MITETDRLRHALDVAAELYPELQGNRSALLRRVLAEGMDAVLHRDSLLGEIRVQSVDELSHQMRGVWPERWREERLAEWPE
jgi:hypothetical protein